jgi:hypothetical protein
LPPLHWLLWFADRQRLHHIIHDHPRGDSANLHQVISNNAAFISVSLQGIAFKNFGQLFSYHSDGFETLTVRKVQFAN